MKSLWERIQSGRPSSCSSPSPTSKVPINSTPTRAGTTSSLLVEDTASMLDMCAFLHMASSNNKGVGGDGEEHTSMPLFVQRQFTNQTTPTETPLHKMQLRRVADDPQAGLRVPMVNRRSAAILCAKRLVDVCDPHQSGPFDRETILLRARRQFGVLEGQRATISTTGDSELEGDLLEYPNPYSVHEGSPPESYSSTKPPRQKDQLVLLLPAVLSEDCIVAADFHFECFCAQRVTFSHRESKVTLESFVPGEETRYLPLDYVFVVLSSISSRNSPVALLGNKLRHKCTPSEKATNIVRRLQGTTELSDFKFSSNKTKKLGEKGVSSETTMTLEEAEGSRRYRERRDEAQREHHAKGKNNKRDREAFQLTDPNVMPEEPMLVLVHDTHQRSRNRR